MRTSCYQITILSACLALLPASLTKAGAQNEARACSVCGGPIGSSSWEYGEKVVCDDCHLLPTKCSVCGLPTHDDYTTTSDGRVICAADAPNAVLTVEHAEEIFEQVRVDLYRLTHGELDLEFPEVTVNLFDVDYWNSNKASDDDMHRVGFSHSRQLDDRQVHSVLVVSGRLEDEFAAVCAHELAHLWVNENREPSRSIDSDTLEAFCEVVAYCLMDDRGSEDGMQRIRANSYTRGKIIPAIEWQERFGLNALLEWVASGTESTLDPGTLVRLKQESILAAMRSPLPVRAAPVHSTLELKGLSGTEQRRFALINDHTFMEEEVASVRLGDSEIVVRCERILADAAVIQVDGEASTRTLYFKQH